MSPRLDSIEERRDRHPAQVYGAILYGSLALALYQSLGHSLWPRGAHVLARWPIRSRTRKLRSQGTCLHGTNAAHLLHKSPSYHTHPSRTVQLPALYFSIGKISSCASASEPAPPPHEDWSLKPQPCVACTRSPHDVLLEDLGLCCPGHGGICKQRLRGATGRLHPSPR